MLFTVTMQGNALDAFFRPGSVAVIGASCDPHKLGYAVLDNLGKHRFPGRIYPINPREKTILGHRAYPSVTKVPGVLDLAIVVVPAALVPGVLEECGRKGVKAAIIISAGFREVGEAGRKLEEEVVAIARRYGVRILGPNCLGVIDTFGSLNASFAEGMPAKWEVAVMTQSGAMATAILDWANVTNVGFCRFVSLGNMADVHEVDLLEHWFHDRECKLIVAYLEGISEGEHFMEAAEQITKKKPLIIMKVGTTEAGAKAVRSHTGSLAGSDEAVAAAFHQAGVIRAKTMEELFDFTMCFSYAPLPKGEQMAIITNAGGPSVMATDTMVRMGISLSKLSSRTVKRLREGLPPASSLHNPVDLLGDAQADRYELALETVLEDKGVHGVIVLLAPQVTTEPEKTAKVIASLAKTHMKPIIAVYMGGVEVARGVDILEKNHIPVCPYPERAVRAMAALVEYSLYLKRDETPAAPFTVDKEKAATIMAGVLRRGIDHIIGQEAAQIFAAYGFPTIESRICRNPTEAIAYAREVGFPLVAKVVSDDVIHKSEAGGVVAGLDSLAKVQEAYKGILARVAKTYPRARVLGISLERQVENGREVILGMKRDPQFGPLLMFGMGGIYVEVLKDVSFRVAPLTPLQAREMIEEIRSYPILAGTRGAAPADIPAIEEALLRLSQLALDFPEIIEVDVNPLRVYPKGEGAIGLDYRVILSKES